MFRTRRTTPKSLLIALSTLAFLAGSSHAADSKALLEDACASALPMKLESTAQSELDVAANGLVLHLDLRTAGLLSIETANEAGSRLEARGLECGRNVGHGVWIERSAERRQIAFSHPGDYYLRLSDHGPERSQPARLTLRFAGAVTVERAQHFDSVSVPDGVLIRQTDFYPDLVTKNEPEEVDPDPNKSAWQKPFLTLLVARVAAFAKNEPEEVDPDPNKRARIPAVSARLALFPASAPRMVMKNEPEEVDPDPNKSSHPAGRIVDGLLSVGDAITGERRVGFISFHLDDTFVPQPRYDAVFGWLAEVLEAERARLRLIAPGTGKKGLRLLDYQPAN